MNALVIEDEDSIQSVIASFLRRFGRENGIEVNIKNLSDPVQGLFELSTCGEYYDVVALDVRMPKLTGDDIYSSLKQTKPHMLSSILFVTGYREDLEIRFPELDLRILDKPFRYDQFSKSLTGIVA